jgi:glucose/mannose transport system substrate-binding protein
MRRLLAVTVVLMLAAGACTGDDPTSATTATDDLEVVSWWTSGSEAAALDALLDAFRQENPGVEPVNAAVAGGAGSAAIVTLARRLQRDDPPDVWQTFAGRAVAGYADRGTVRDVTSVFDTGDLRASTHPAILRALTHDGRPYGVATGAHRGNVLWFNTAALAKAGVAPPSAGYDLAAFLGDLRRLRDAGVTPLCLGARDPFTTVELFENVLLSVVGADGWRNLTGDALDWRGGRVQEALRSFGEILGHADPQAGGLTWDAAMTKLRTGGCAYASMNDSAYGELVADGGREGTDFGAVPFPGTGGSFLAVVDVFVAAKQAGNARNALAFLGVINRPSAQVAFSRAKGSVPVVRGVDVSTLPAYQRAASADLWKLPVLMSVTHGQAMSPEFQEGFYDAVQAYVRTRDPGAFADALEDAVARDRIPPR